VNPHAEVALHMSTTRTSLLVLATLTLAGSAAPARAADPGLATSTASPTDGSARRPDRGAAVYDAMRVLNSVCEGKVAKATLKKEFTEKQRVIDAAKADLDAKRASLSEAEANEKLAELRELFARSQREVTDHEREASTRIFDRIALVLREIERDEGYASTVEKAKAGSQQDRDDVTALAISRYDARFPVEGCAPSAGPR